MNILQALNGKKSAIGASILTILVVSKSLGLQVPDVQEEQIMHVLGLVSTCIGSALSIWGVVHKIIKAMKPTIPPTAPTAGGIVQK